MSRSFHLPLAILIGVVVRVPFWVEALRTPLDGDTAIVGLMARHPGAGLTMWGQPYGSPLEAWLAAPLVAALGPSDEALRLLYFLLGLCLIPVAYALAGAVHPRAALPAAVLMACPPPYFLLLASLPPPMYPAALLLCGLVLVLALRAGAALVAGGAPVGRLAVAGALAGVALWTHLMAATAIACAAGHLWRCARGRRRLLLVGLAPLLLAGAPSAWRLLTDAQAVRVVGVSGRQQSMAEHLAEVVPSLHRPLGGLLGTHVPVIADDPDHVVYAPGPVAFGLIVTYGFALVLAVRRRRSGPGVGLLLAAAAACLLVFPFPVRSGPASIRFLTPLYLPLVALVTWVPAARSGARRAWVVVLLLACLHLIGGTRLLATWRALDRSQPPFLLPDLGPVRQVLEVHGIRHAYASYGPAYRLTFETGELIVVSQPWNERFRHHPLPYLDEVRFAKNVAWVLTPTVPSDLPAPIAFESALDGIGGGWRRTRAGPAVVYHGFAPPFAPQVTPLPGAGPAGDGDVDTVLTPAPGEPLTLRLPTPVAADALTLVAPASGWRLPRSMDVEVSADGVAFETVARRRRREERADLRWVNGHPQYLLDHDHLAVSLGGRGLAAVRIRPVASAEPWGLAEALVHPAGAPPLPWDEWLDPGLSWSERRRALDAVPRHERADFYYRLLLARRRGSP